MALQSSGEIRMSQINTELGRSSTAQISLDTAENGGYATINTNSSSRPSASNPASMSEWYGYNHSAAPSITYTYYGYYYYNDPCQGGAAYYTGSDGNWYEGDGTNFTEVTGSFVAIYSYYDYWTYEYFYDLYYLAYGGTLQYWGGVTSQCAPY